MMIFKLNQRSYYRNYKIKFMEVKNELQRY